MGQVGFGSYRVSFKSAEHKAALVDALKAGCSLIDTSSNYTNGDSEELIGTVLSEHPEFKPIIVTKAGYIQGKNLKTLEELNAAGLATEDLVDLSDTLKHSIHPDFLKSQLDQSLKRLKRDSVDFFLLHNPEYYFQLAGASKDEYYLRLKKAFIFCEEEVSAGRIKAYGVSSNNFVLPIDDPHATDLSTIIGILTDIKAKNFKMVQFPFNLIEIGALEKLGEYGDESLLELCMRHGFLSVINRPLNAFTQNKLVRFATYENVYSNLDEKTAEEKFSECLNLLRTKWTESSDETTTSDDFDHVEIISQFRNLWNTLPTPDAVEQVYFGHIFPFVARIWGKSLTPAESKPFYDLMEYSQIYSRRNLSVKAIEFKNQALQVGLLSEQEEKPFAVMAVETYLDYGFDYVLIGMKKPEYVDQMKHLF
ncbi:MAG: aldo/keto reductase [Bacteriovorax sp.]|nr:aldo/keto reductase [Bacteriovorax sp.]